MQKFNILSIYHIKTYHSVISIELGICTSSMKMIYCQLVAQYVWGGLKSVCCINLMLVYFELKYINIYILYVFKVLVHMLRINRER